MARQLKVNIKGSKELQRQLKRAEQELLRESVPVVTTATRTTFALSQATVPVESGALKASGKVHPAEVRHAGDVSFATVEYDDPHAALIHEGYFGSDQRVNAPPKFLRDAAKTGRKAFRKELRRFFKSFLKSRFSPKE